ncbi:MULTISPECIES: hypothetical protein [Hydrocarboniphaga]|uniref:hypothetical protein n=1 Tax=Hydrocarboniphaga TaxID=243627 RepID=UPI0012F86134|nr:MULTISPECIES: hypothetical protein [Hydrocarboniphaga]MDZ4077620.1 hypothetical protein [Hydrocarboniphaga sp.]
MKDQELNGLIVRALGATAANQFDAFRLTDTRPLAASARELMGNIEPMPGACALLSATWALYLRDRFNIPAVVVAGDLKVAGQWVFRGTSALPPMGNTGAIIRGSWKGHCWIEIDNLIGDLSLFRTAYSRPPESVLRQFVESTFGHGRGAFLAPTDEVPQGLRYRRRFVLTLRQMEGFLNGQEHLMKASRSDLAGAAADI